MKPDTKKIQETKPIKELLEFSIINIDKPSGPTSFGVDTIIKKELNLNKTSHFGTLDPMVTGVLPIALSRACKLMNYFIGKNKTYVGIMRTHKEISLEELNKQIKPFLGKITQLPPVKSRVKRQERERTIHTFKILEKNNKDFLFETEVQAGTYIRKLIHDVGEKIGGAHMLELRRTQASIFKENNSVKITEFLEAIEQYKKGNETPLREILIPGEIISTILPTLQVKPGCIKNLYQGKPFFKKYITSDYKPKKDELITIFQEDKFIGVYKTIAHETVLAKSEFVLQPIKQQQ
ncbi:RNA-guided pseudouridylation complex pseudouridine synthase subunit Cbf5 [Candidatus Pacearchaeota archaeon]|nr:RNA-guided pseudouridylation complex pseudouridine synthase subunit Cbf5 [Candidatus Pacearchaeota archaeon]|tara:strand:- start:3051 stop:3929 length:879 start_codon:yes stop_codon:yes gene_type:complete